MDVVITDDPDTDHLIAEIWDGEKHIADILQQDGKDDLMIVIYPDMTGKPWEIELNGFTNALNKARHRLRPSRTM